MVWLSHKLNELIFGSIARMLKSPKKVNEILTDGLHLYRYQINW